jgi:hypothetical protein
VFHENSWGTANGAWTAVGNDVQFSARSGDLVGGVDDGLLRQRDWTGKGEFIVRLNELNNPDPAAKAGLMMRAHADSVWQLYFLDQCPDERGDLAFTK